MLAVLFYGFYATAQELDCENLETQILEAYNGSIEMKALGEEEKNDKKKQQMMRRASGALSSAANMATIYSSFCTGMSESEAESDSAGLDAQMANAKELCIKLDVEDGSDRMSTCILKVISD